MSPREVTNKKQQGFSLVELMIALLIGLFLMGGVISVYLGSSQSSKLNESLLLLQDHARYSIQFLNDVIQKAGYTVSLDPSKKVSPFLTSDPSVDFNTEIVITSESDLDCANKSTAATGGVAINHIFVRGSSISVRGTPNGDLTCAGGPIGSTHGWDLSLITNKGVDALRFLYGLDDNNDGQANRYVTADTVSAIPNAWENQVKSVRVGLLLSSKNDVKKQAESSSYSMLDKTFGPYNDRLLRKVFTTTILLRNEKG